MSRLSERNVRDIARKLAESEGCEPPAGLLEKIKAEIPEVTVGTAVPGSERRSVMLRQRWLIAASLVAAVGAGLVGVRTWQGEGERLEVKARSQAAAPRSVAAAKPAAPPAGPGALERLAPPPPPKPSQALGGAPAAEVAPSAAPAPKPRKDLQSLDSTASRAEEPQIATAESPLMAMRQNLPAPAPPPPPPPASQVVGGTPGPVEGGPKRGVAGGVPTDVARTTSTPAVSAEPPFIDEPLLDQGVLLDERRVETQTRQAKKEKPHDGVLSQLQPAGTDPFVDAAAHPLSTLKLGVDTASYAVACRALANGHLPDPTSVRVEEWVNAFDYGDPVPARGDFAIRAEGAPLPFAHGPEHRLLRLNFREADEPKGTHAGNAEVQVQFNPVVVARYRLLGSENRAIPGSAASHSITALYEIELRPNAPHWEQPVATLHLRYQVPGVGNTTETIRRVGFEDFAPTWEQASPGLRLASLVAELAEILNGSPWTRGDDLGLVARRIQEVARQFPGNAKVTELVDMAARAARLKTGQVQPEE
ncbi:MAG: von Willebrand factor type A domain-containing protein [Acidobacteria bacterium]|nr:von Willebrand factor type A domain-containing protein [Acidobacteriota bacterium]